MPRAEGLPPLPIALLGVAAFPTLLDPIVNHILNRIAAYKKDLRPRYVTTLKAHHLMSMHKWFSDDSRFPELLHIFRAAAAVTIDSSPLLWLSKLLGSPAKQNNSVDLLTKLAETLAEKNLSLFLLGGEEKTIKLTTLYLQALYPTLKIVGASHPHILIDGEDLYSATEHDDLLIEEINQASPDVLALNLGSPKQEIWYERIQQRLHVPVTVGLDGAFDRLTGLEPRSPEWMQDSGFEGVFRTIKKPHRIVSFAKDAMKFLFLTSPLVVYHNINKWLFRLTHYRSLKERTLHNPLLFLSAHHTLAVMQLPSLLDRLVVREMMTLSDDLFSHDVVVLDFNEVGHLDLEGIALLLQLWKRALKEKKQLFALGMKKHIQVLLKLHRAFDCLRPYLSLTPADLLTRLVPNGISTGFYDSLHQTHNHLILSYFGRLDHHQDYDIYLDKISPMLHQKECLVDLTYCTYIDNTGIAFLLRLRKMQPQHFISFKLVGLNSTIRRQLQQANVLQLML